MLSTRITWVIGGALAALLILAGVDALRSPADGESAATPSTPASVDVDGTIEAKSFEGDGYSFTYPREWTRRPNVLASGKRVWTAFAPDAETASAQSLNEELGAVFARGKDILVLQVLPQREPLGEGDVDAYLHFRRGWLNREGALLQGPTRVAVAGLPAFRTVIDLGGDVALQETIIFDRMTWYFLTCRFNSEEMERGCDQVEETFEVA